jgi:ubiquinol-cytochrome c reductase iron-sulfur subunit
MSQNKVGSKRMFLIAAASAVGGAAAATVVIPLLSHWTKRTAGERVEADIGKLAPGTMMTVAWRGKPVWIVNRNQAQMDALGRHDDKLTDPQSQVQQQPEYCRNATRSRKEQPNILVAVAVCTHLGCTPSESLKAGSSDGMADDWPGGFICPCHGSRFDLAARVFKGSPALVNLLIPPYQYLSDSLIQLGEN